MRYAPLVPKPKPSDTGKRKLQRQPVARNFVDLTGLTRAPWGQRLPTGIMAKLEVGDVNDPLEREADAVADRVMRMPAPSRETNPGPAPEAADAELDVEEEEEELSETPTIGRFADLPASLPFRERTYLQPRVDLGSGDFAERLRGSLRAGGRPLSDDARNFLESRLGVDLGVVRLHDDAPARALAQRINARAFTFGQDVFFGAGELRPQSQSGMRLLAHEVAHTLQGPGFALRRVPETDSTSESIAAVDPGEDLLEQSDAIFKAVDGIRRNLQRVLVDLVMPNEEGINGLDDYDLPKRLRDQTKASATRYRKVTRYLESRSTLESVLMVQWLDAALEVIQLLRKCVSHIAAHDEYVGEVVEVDYGKPLQRLATRAKRLRKHEFFQQGAEIENELRPLEEAQARAEREAEIATQLDLVRSDMRAYWNWQSRQAIEAEHTRLSTKLFVMGGKSTTGVLEAQLEVLAELADPSNYQSEGSITERAQRLARLAASDLARGAQAFAGAIVRGLDSVTELTIVIDAFRWLEFEDSATRVDRLAPLVLDSFADPSAVLAELDASELGKIVLEWLAPPRRPEAQFALLVIWADPEGRSTRDPADATSKLREQSRAARANSVRTATAMLQRSARLARYAESAGTRRLLIEMAYQLWLDGFAHDKVATGDVLANALASEISGDTAVVIADGDLSIDWDGDDMLVDVDPVFNARGKPIRVPASAGVWLNGSDSPLMPALKLLEVEARGDRNFAVAAGQDLAKGAGDAGTAANEWLESRAKRRLEWAGQKLDDSIALAREMVVETVPAEYQDYALEVVSGLEVAGDAVLTGVTYVEGMRIGVTKGAIDTATGIVGLAGTGLAGAGELGSDALEGDVLEDIGVNYRETEHTLLVTVDAVPEIAEGLYEKFQAMEGRDKVFLVGKAVGQVVFEVATTVAGGGVAKVEKLDDIADLGKMADKHSHAVDSGLRRRADLEADLPANTEVWIDDSLRPGDVRVEYDAPGGVVDSNSVRIVTGRDANPRWIELHGATVTAIRKYSGLQGRMRKLLARLTGADEAGTPQWEAKFEVQKLEPIVDAELAALRRAAPQTKEAEAIQEGLEGLTRQFEHWSRVADGEITPGVARGFIAAEDYKPKRNYLDMPRRTDDMSPGELDTLEDALKAARLYDKIAENEGDVAAIAANLGIDPAVVARVKKHHFIDEHDVLVPHDPSQTMTLEHGQFNPTLYVAERWISAGSSAANKDKIVSWLAHEYIEASLMDAGLPYTKREAYSYDAQDGWLNNASATDYGAHDLAPSAHAQPPNLDHWRRLQWVDGGVDLPVIKPDLSNLDEVVAAIKRLKKLQ